MVNHKHPLITVYIANFNYGRYLKRAIQSVLDQTMQDFELIIIDDGSTDCSHEILKNHEPRERTFIILQKNKGLSATNNIALKLARGKYIMRLDADDYLDPHALEVMVSTLEKDTKLALVFPDFYVVDEQGGIIEQMQRHDFEREVSLLDRPAHGACTMIRRDVLLAVGGYDETFKRQDGYDLWLKIINNYPVKNIRLPLFHYRRHEGSLSRSDEQLLKTRSEIKAKHVKKRGLKPLSVLTIVPVRGSVADPRSLPLAPLGDRCLIDWTLEAGLGSQYVTDVLVTTPDLQLKKYVRKKYTRKVLLWEREPELARNNKGIEETVLDALKFYKQKHSPPDVLLILYIEAPFRTTMYIDKAIHTMQLYNVDVVDGVRLDDGLFYVHRGNGLRPWKPGGGLRLERDVIYRRVGGLHLIKREFFEAENRMLSGRIGHIELDEKAAFFIESEFDWQIARFLAEKRK